MIDPVAGWSWSVTEDSVTLISPEGPSAGGVRYQERRRPLMSLRDLIAELPVPRGYRLGSVSPIERLVTREGEHAAAADIAGSLDGAPVWRTVGAVFLDDYMAVAVGRTCAAAEAGRIAALVRRLVLGDRHRLGARRRRFELQPPPGWTGFIVGDLFTTWVPPEHPRDGRKLLVHPATPQSPGVDEVPGLRDHMLATPGLTLDVPAEDEEPVRFRTARGLAARWWRLRATAAGQATLCDLLFLEDERAIYPLALTAPVADAAGAATLLRRLADSVEPLPRAGQGAAPAVRELSTMWAA